jgi:hypothetical protein
MCLFYLGLHCIPACSSNSLPSWRGGGCCTTATVGLVFGYVFFTLQDNLPLSYEFHPHQNEYLLFVVELPVPPEAPSWTRHSKREGHRSQQSVPASSSEACEGGNTCQSLLTESVQAQQEQQVCNGDGGGSGDGVLEEKGAGTKKPRKKQWQQPAPQYTYRWGYAPSSWLYKMQADEPRQFAFEGGVASVGRTHICYSNMFG